MKTRTSQGCQGAGKHAFISPNGQSGRGAAAFLSVSRPTATLTRSPACSRRRHRPVGPCCSSVCGHISFCLYGNCPFVSVDGLPGEVEVPQEMPESLPVCFLLPPSVAFTTAGGESPSYPSRDAPDPHLGRKLSFCERSIQKVFRY